MSRREERRDAVVDDGKDAKEKEGTPNGETVKKRVEKEKSATTWRI